VAFGTVLSWKLHRKIVGGEGGRMCQHVIWASLRKTEWQSCGGPEPGRLTVSRDGGWQNMGAWELQFTTVIVTKWG
jgi:hypothetical protein